MTEASGFAHAERRVHRDIDRDQAGAARPRNLQAHRRQQADVAGAGFAVRQRARHHARQRVAGRADESGGRQQGLITEEGYKVQARSYQNMGKAAEFAAQAEDEAATGIYVELGLQGRGHRRPRPSS
jgi:hypothetical protein